MAKGISTVLPAPAKEKVAPVADKIEQMRKEESRLVKGVFQDNEVKGGTLKFPFKKYPGEPITTWVLTDGQEYELPLSIVRHLNSGCCYVENAYLNNMVTADGKPMLNPNPKKKHRFNFKISEYS